MRGEWLDLITGSGRFPYCACFFPACLWHGDRDILHGAASRTNCASLHGFWEFQMTEFKVNDIVRVEMPRGYSNRGVLGVSLMFTTSMEAKFEGAIGTITSTNPDGPQGVHQYLVDFRTHDNSRVGIPWQAQWFREEWLALKERPEAVSAAKAAQDTPDATWPERADEGEVSGGIAHPGAKIFTEG